jgi:hypothetical protein
MPYCGPALRWLCGTTVQGEVIHKEIISEEPVSCIALASDDAVAYLGCWDRQVVTYSVRA